MYALLILDMQVGLVHGPDKPWAGEALLDTLNTLLDKARSAGAPVFLARHVGPTGSPIEPGSPLTQLIPELVLQGSEVIFEKNRPNA
ncbi:MAG: isochorismatase family protein, partial [Pseudomonas sp.]|nr:isochorismatase family protein [Pseudomonas sp.]